VLTGGTEPALSPEPPIQIEYTDTEEVLFLSNNEVSWNDENEEVVILEPTLTLVQETLAENGHY